MPNFKQFIANLDKRGQELEDNVGKAVRAVALEIDSAVVQSTPVDTGRARSNWIVQINSSATGEVSSGSIDRSGQGALSRGRSTIAGFKAGKDRSIHITNNVPYIGDLNNGTSAQAPANFVQAAVEAGATAVRNSRIFT